jgi:serine/threonine protein kinase/Flp pilus assembly protein TadD
MPPDETADPPDGNGGRSPLEDTRTQGDPGFAGAFAPARQLGDFELLRELGRGGMGVVYEARQISLNRRVALKVLPPGLALSREAVKRFEREAKAAGKLHHTNIVPVYAIGQAEGCHYYAMELIEGQSLAVLLALGRKHESNPLMDPDVFHTTHGSQPGRESSERPSSTTSSVSETSSRSRAWFDATAKLLAEVADALDYAHQQGIIHRDIKPANPLLSHEYRLCVTDFGLARMTQEPGMTVSGSFLGTPAYMSPEMIAVGRIEVDHRTDVYSLGAVLYEMLTLETAFPEESRDKILSAIMTKDPRPPRKINPRIPLDLETICLKAMEKDADRRYQTAGDFAHDLRQHLQRGLITARRASLARRLWKKTRQHPVAAVTLVSVLVVASVAGFSWHRVRQADVPRLISEARLLLVQGEYREGLEKISQALDLDPRALDARLVRARMLLQRTHYEEAAEEARAVLREDPADWEAHMVMAVLGKKGGLADISAGEHMAAVEGNVVETADAFYLRGLLADSHRDAIGWLDRALDLNPGHALALLERGSRYGSLKNLPASLADAERLMAVRPFSAQGRRLKAAAYGAMHDEERALEYYAKAIELDPDDPITYRQRAAVLLERGRGDDALADYTTAIELDAEVSEFLSRRSWLYNAKKEYDLAIADARRALAVNPDDRRAYRYLMHAYWNSGRRDEALAALETLQARASAWANEEALTSAHDLTWWYYRNAGDLDRALAEADRVIELQPAKLRGYQLRAQIERLRGGEVAMAETCDGMVALELDEPQRLFDRANLMADLCRRVEQAQADYSAAIELAPSWADPYQKRGRLHKREKRFDEALADLDRAIQLAPTWTQAVYNRGQIHSDLERFEQALEDYERCAELGAGGIYFRWNMAMALLRLNREEEALAVIDEFLETNPKDSEMLFNRAWALFRMGRLDEALATADRAVDAQPSRALPYTMRSWIAHFKKDGCEQVRRDFESASRLAEDSADTWSARAEQMVIYGELTCPGIYDPAAALDLARKAVAYDSGSPDYQRVLGIALYRNERFEEASDALLRALELRVNEEPADLLFLAMTSARLADLEGARTYYDRAVELIRATFPNDPEARRLRQEAAEVLNLP